MAFNPLLLRVGLFATSKSRTRHHHKSSYHKEVRFKLMRCGVRVKLNSLERLQAMESTKVSDEEIVCGLQRHPRIKSRVAAVLAVEEDSNGISSGSTMRWIG